MTLPIYVRFSRNLTELSKLWCAAWYRLSTLLRVYVWSALARGTLVFSSFRVSAMLFDISLSGSWTRIGQDGRIPLEKKGRSWKERKLVALFPKEIGKEKREISVTPKECVLPMSSRRPWEYSAC